MDFAKKDPRIGYVAAYGDLWANLEDQASGSSELAPMHENWGAALTRNSWLAQKPVREHYWNLIKNNPYSARDHHAIREFYRSLGFICDYTSQDSSRWVACCVAGMVRLTTTVCQAQYIGASGVHFTPEIYDRFGFSKSIICPDRPTISPPCPEQLRDWIEETRQNFQTGYVHSYQKSILLKDAASALCEYNIALIARKTGRSKRQALPSKRSAESGLK